MNLRSIDLNLLVIFDAILAEGTLTQAAERIGMSQPAMSNALNRLRAMLADPLFERHGHRMEPTPKARQLAGPVREALDLIQANLSQDGAFDFRTATTVFSVATEDFGQVVIMPRLMNWLHRAAPSVRVKIQSERGGAAQMELRRGRIDLALDYIPIEGAELEVMHLLKEVRVCVGRRDHPGLHEGITVDDYLALPHAVLNRTIPGGSIVTRELKRQGLVRNVVMETPDYLSILTVLLQTDLVCTMPRRVAQTVAENHPLKIVALPVVLPDLDIYMSWNKSTETNAAARWFRNSVAALCGRL